MPDVLKRHNLSDIYASKRFCKVCDDFALHSLSDLFAFSRPGRWTQDWHKALVSIPNFGPVSLSHLIKAIHDYGFDQPDILYWLLETKFYTSPPYKTNDEAKFAKRETQAILMHLSPEKTAGVNS